MAEAFFDAYAARYRAEHAASVAFAGIELDYFARYKAELARSEAERCGLAVGELMDFGAGVGSAAGALAAAFPEAMVRCVDVSAESLAVCAGLGLPTVTVHAYDGRTLPFGAGTVDLAFAACVFHHIPAEQHVALMAEVRRTLAPGGLFMVFEHNPFNPLTRLAVVRCPFDADAVLIRRRELARRLAAAGFSNLRGGFRVFFPGALAALRPLERWLAPVPAGGQYYVAARA